MFLEVNQKETDMKVPEVLKPYRPEKCYKVILLLPQLQSMKQRPKVPKSKGRDQDAAFYANYDANHQRTEALGVFQSQVMITEKAARVEEAADKGDAVEKEAEARAEAAKYSLKYRLEYIINKENGKFYKSLNKGRTMLSCT